MAEEQPFVYIVDDDKFLLDMYSTKFQESGIRVETSLSSEEALQQIQGGSVNPNVILLDLVMPTVDGFEMLKRLREGNLVPNARVIVLSNLGEQGDIEKARQWDVDDYIVKASMTPSEVVARVKEIIGN